MVGSMKGVLSGKKVGVRNFLVEYLQIWGGDFASPSVRVRENKDE